MDEDFVALGSQYISDGNLLLKLRYFWGEHFLTWLIPSNGREECAAHPISVLVYLQTLLVPIFWPGNALT